jgi:two-component system, sensor histidine kinase PdtaS
MLNKLAAMRAWPLWLRLGLAAIILGAAYAFQIPLEREVPGEPFLLFFIIVIISALAFGEYVGFLACGASAALSAHFFEPLGSIAVHHATDLIKIELYAVICALSILGVGRLRSAIVLLYVAMSNNEKKSAILLEEMAHRTSNNFAVVAALLRSKASTVAEPDAKTILEDAVEQIVTMARLHRSLRVTNDDITVDSRNFISALAGDLKDAMGKNRPVCITSRAASCALPVAQAIPLGLIVNELVTNAVKHAFPDGRSGTIRVNLDKREPNELVLTVEDDGIGLQGQHLSVGSGQTIIGHLIDQLGGRVERKSSNRGASFNMTFPAMPSMAPSAEKGTLH